MPTLDWIGKDAVINHHQEVPFHLLKCDNQLSVGDPGSGNLLVQGDIHALREGWDCPFAYVLCGIAEMRSNTAVEQILGRVMRLPRVTWKKREELNQAYAFVASPHFFATANALTDALVKSGFERQEARDFIVAASNAEQTALPLAGAEFMGTVTVDMPKAPRKAGLSQTTAGKFDYHRGERKFTFHGEMTRAERRELKDACEDDESRDAVEIAYRLSNKLPLEGHGAPAERGQKLEIPLLAVRQGDLFEAFEETHFLDRPWSLSECDASLAEEEYASDRRQSQHGLIDEEKGRLTARFIDNLHEQMILFASDAKWTAADLAHWLRRSILHRDLSPQDVDVFCARIVLELTRDRHIPLEQLCHDKYRLKIAVAEKLDKHRESARHSSFQGLLALDCETPLVVTPDCVFSYDPRQYPYARPYRGRYEFQKHYYAEVGDLNETGEEFECAQFIDQMDEIEYWVRNIPQRDRHSFWLQTIKDRFYPDFVCKLKDGRILVVEYKGAHLIEHDEHKKIIGELWAKRSNGIGLFVEVSNRNFEGIRAMIS